MIVAGLVLLGRSRPRTDLDALAAWVRTGGPRLPWEDVARGEPA